MGIGTAQADEHQHLHAYGGADGHRHLHEYGEPQAEQGRSQAVLTCTTHREGSTPKWQEELGCARS